MSKDIRTQITHPEQVVGGGGRGSKRVESKPAPMGYERQKDLLNIVCALVANPNFYPHIHTDDKVIEVASNLLTLTEAKS